MKYKPQRASVELEAWADWSHGVAREHGFVGASRFEQMRARYGTWTAMVMLVESPEIQSGFTWCHEKNLLPISIESGVIKFASEFHPGTVQCAKWRLKMVSAEEKV